MPGSTPITALPRPQQDSPEGPSPAGVTAEPGESPASASRDTSLGVRLDLQRNAARNLRAHLFRGARRVLVLMVADLVAFQLMRLVFRAIRNNAVIGETIAGALQNRLPSGYLGGWQFASALILGLYVTGNYNQGDDRRDPRRLFAGCALAVALPLWLSIWTDGLGLVLLQYTLTVLLVWGVLVAERLTVDKLVGRVFSPGRRAARTLFVGPAKACREAALNPGIMASGDYINVGFVDLAAPTAPDALGHFTRFREILHQTRAEAVVACGYLPDHHLHDVAETALASGCQLLSVPRSIAVAGVQPSVVWREGQPLVELSTPSLKGQELILKRLVDLVGATLGLLLAAPIMLIAAIAIRLDSPGPVFFRQERIGTGGRRFRVWKFRTMKTDASEDAHRELVTRMLVGQELGTAHTGTDGTPVYKLVNDPRVTRVGAFLRRTSIDELPQLFNVLVGDMSLVGPRPPLPYEFEAYDHWQYDRLQVRPGITGLWQVSGRNLLTYRQMCELDVEYVRCWSLYLDFKILLKTVPVVLFNSGRAA